MLGRTLRGAIVFACLVMLAASCSSSDASSNANYVAVDPASSTTDDVDADQSAASTVSTQAPAGTLSDEIASVVETFDTFLEIRAAVITGDAELTDLATVATPAAIEQVSLLRSTNDAKIASDAYSALSNLAEWSNITEVIELGDELRFRDCTESQYVTPGGFTVVNFVTNDVSILDVDGQLKVDNITIAQDGVASTSDEILGCVPSSFLDQATQTAQTAVEAVDRLIQDPSRALSEGLPSIFVDEARTDLERGLQSLSSEGLIRIADETVEYTVLGMDVNKPDFTVVVSVCRTYPNGRTYTDRDGAQTISDIPTGSSYEEWVYVHLETVSPDDAVAPNNVVTEVHDRGPNCERG